MTAEDHIKDILRNAFKGQPNEEELVRIALFDFGVALENASSNGYDEGVDIGDEEGYRRGFEDGKKKGIDEGIGIASDRIRQLAHGVPYGQRERMVSIARGNY